MIFLGLASNYTAKDIFRHSFILGTKKDYQNLESEISRRYNADPEKVSLLYSGRSAIAIALRSLLESGKLSKGDHVAVNAFTCHAVVEAIRFAEVEPVYIDLEKVENGQILPNYSAELLEKTAKKDKKLKAFILQNTFGFPVDIRKFEKVKKEYKLSMIEDLAHCAGRKYPDGREIGNVGDITCLSFGKGKAIDTITGGAIIIRNKELKFPATFSKKNLTRRQRNGDVPRASWYPLFAAIARGLSHLHLEKYWLGLLLKIKWIERSADTKLLTDTTITYWQAKLALRQVKNLKNSAIREFYMVTDREACLNELKKHGYRLEELWYEVPIAPKRYYKATKFPEKNNPNAVYFAEHVVNLPTWYKTKRRKKEVEAAKKIIKTYEIRGSR